MSQIWSDGKFEVLEIHDCENVDFYASYSSPETIRSVNSKISIKENDKNVDIFENPAIELMNIPRQKRLLPALASIPLIASSQLMDTDNVFDDVSPKKKKKKKKMKQKAHINSLCFNALNSLKFNGLEIDVNPTRVKVPVRRHSEPDMSRSVIPLDANITDKKSQK